VAGVLVRHNHLVVRERESWSARRAALSRTLRRVARKHEEAARRLDRYGSHGAAREARQRARDLLQRADSANNFG
jgi:hypothetical protein